MKLPWPSSPSAPSPQASTWPWLVSARLLRLPAPSAVAVAPGGKAAKVGTFRWVKMPSPSCPKVLSPQVSTDPVLMSATMKPQPCRT
jgi:hypothetical protein